MQTCSEMQSTHDTQSFTLQIKISLNTKTYNCEKNQSHIKIRAHRKAQG